MRLISPERSAAQSEQARKQHRDAWLIVLGIGCLIIILGNLVGIGPWWLATTVAACMIGYGVFIERTVDEADVPGDAKGDAIYYLGLLFTFAALVAALITFDWGAPGAEASGTTGSIRNFGIALLTTIVGLAGRVWFTMSQESPGDLVDTARSQLEETVARMKESLDRARDDLDIMAHKFRDSAAGLGEMAETIADGTRKAAETYAALDEYAGHIAGATRALVGEMDGLRGVCGASGAALAALQGRADELGEHLGGVHAHLEDRLGRAQTQLDRAEAAFDRMNEVAGSAADRVNATLRGVEGTDAAVSALGKSLSGVRSGADRAKDALAGIADAVDHHQVLPLWKEAVDQLHEGTRGIRGIGRNAAGMNAEFDGLRASVKAASEGLATVPGRTAALSSDLEDARQHARRLSDSMRLVARADGDGAADGAPITRLRRAMAGARRVVTRLTPFWRKS